MSAAQLLDANAPIALVAGDHVHHDRVVRRMNQARSVAWCPIVEGLW